MVFTELLEMLEAKFSPEFVDRVLSRAKLAHGGAYTAVGYYPHSEMVELLKALTDETGLSSDQLQGLFGEHLLGRFAHFYPQLFAEKPTLFDFLASIDSHIHVEVRKLYPDAKLPRFSVLSREPGRLRLSYESPRQMVGLAEGLIRGAAQHYAEPHEVSNTTEWLDGRSITVLDVRRLED